MKFRFIILKESWSDFVKSEIRIIERKSDLEKDKKMKRWEGEKIN